MNFNPYMPSYGGYQLPQVQVVKVNGEGGARSYQMGANSSALLLDETGTMVWLVTSDGAGYKTVMPYDIAPHKVAPEPDFTTLEQRIARLEETVNGYTTNTSAVKRKKPVESDTAD